MLKYISLSRVLGEKNVTNNLPGIFWIQKAHHIYKREKTEKNKIK